jgi:hypothetical protein
MYEWGFQSDFLRSKRVESGVVGEREDVGGRSLPKQHCPQKAVVVQAAIATLSEELRSRLPTNRDSMVALIGGLNGCLECLGARLCMPLRT